MQLPLCSKCKERVAVFFINRVENGVTKSLGFCRKCALELNDPKINEILGKIKLPEEAEEALDIPVSELENMDISDGDAAEEDGEDGDGQKTSDGKTPFFDLNKIIGPFANILGGMTPPSPAPADGARNENAGGEPKKTEPHNRKKKFLTLYCTDLTDKAKKGETDEVIGRDRELERVMQILCRRQKNNPCLIGEPGVGKTAVAEALALRISRGEVPAKLKGKEVHLLDMTALVAGTQFRGQFEKRMKDLIEEVKRLGNIILVIDEVHTIASAGDSEGSMNAANIMKPALSRGEIQVIGATTLKEYRQYIEKDAALERRFQPVMINEPSLDETVKILEGIAKYYEDFHGVKSGKDILRRAAVMSERYITDRFLPDKAIDLLDEALSRVSMKSPSIDALRKAEGEYQDTAKKVEELKAVTEPEDSEKYFRDLAEAQSDLLRLGDEVEKARTEAEKVVLTERDLAEVIEIWTGIPASNITEGDFLKVQRLDETLKGRIVGQDEAIEAVVRAVKRSRAGISPKKKPVSFIFAGPTGVGKTELVKVLASALFDSPETLIRLDMSEFMEKFSVSRIIGAPPGYVGYDEAGQLTEKIRRKPYSVVLFDEIEKAHPDVMNILLQILDDGRVTDAQGRTVNFENTVIVMTTNAGSEKTASSLGFGATTHEGDREKTEKALSSFLRPEFLNRVDEVIVFNRLGKESFVGIADIMLGELKASLEEKGVKLFWTDEVRDAVAEKSFSDTMGARNMRRYISRNIEDKIADILFSEPGVSGVNVTLSDGEYKFDLLS